MKTIAGVAVLILMLTTSGVTAAADVTITEPFPDGYVLNPADSGDTLVFGDVQASITSIETAEDDNNTVQMEIVNNSRVTLWVSPDMLKSFTEGRFNSAAGTETGPILFEVTSMETSEGVAEIVYEWYMAIPAGGTGTVTLNVSQEIEKICYQPFSQNQSGLTDEETQRIHGCWLLTEGEATGEVAPDAPRALDTPLVGDLAPDFTLETFDGEGITLSEQQGNVVIVHFWGSWCEPCTREMPNFQAYWESSPEDVSIIGIGSKQDSPERSREFAEQFDITYPIGRDVGGDRVTVGTISEAFSLFAYPMTFVIDPDGAVSSVILGELDFAELDKYVEKARKDAEVQSAAMKAIYIRLYKT